MKKAFGLLIIVLVVGFFVQKAFTQKNDLKIGDKVPSFKLKDQFGNEFDSRNSIGKKTLVIYFYPKDDTPGCTKQACKFRDEFESFTDLGVEVIGISGDDVASHKAFADRYSLPFILLADINNEVRTSFGVAKSLLGLIPGRVTYIVNKKGVVVNIFNHLFNAENHISEAIAELKK